MQNFVVSGRPTVIIRCGCDFEINNIEYKKGQPVCILQDIETEFTYNTIENAATRGPQVLNYSAEAELVNIKLKEVPFNNMLHNLIFGAAQQTVDLPKAYLGTSKNGRIAIPYAGPIKDIIVQNMEYEIVPFTLEEGNIINGLEDGHYLISYRVPLHKSTKLDTKPKRIPYFTIETVANGNEFDNKRKSMLQYIHINKAALRLDPFFIFNDSINNFDLDFTIIKDENNFISYGEI